MNRTVKVLLVDDKEDYCISLAGVAREEGMQLIYELDWEIGFQKLKAEPNIEFVILDGKGKIETDQAVEKDNFVFRAIRDIESYSKEVGKPIPFCVNTGFIDNFGGLEGNAVIFEKSESDRDKLFEYIRNEVKKTHYHRCRMHFEEAFAAFDNGIIPKKHERLLTESIEAYFESDFRKVNIILQRDLLEAIFKSLSETIPCIPPEFFNQGRPNHEYCTRFLEGRPVERKRIANWLPGNISGAFRKLKESTNQYAHLADDAILKLPFLANTFLLMEILEWLPEYGEKFYGNYV